MTDKNEEWGRLVKEMNLTPAMLTKLTGVNRSTLHGYQSGKSAPTALSLGFLRLLKFMHDRDPKLFLEYVTLSEFGQVESGAKDPQIAKTYLNGILPDYLDGYRKYLMTSYFDPE